MEAISDHPRIKFGSINDVFLQGQKVDCCIFFQGYQFSEDDKISLWGSVSGEDEKCFSYQLVKEGELSREGDVEDTAMTFIFQGYEFSSVYIESYKFKYMTADLRILAESNSFAITEKNAAGPGDGISNKKETVADSLSSNRRDEAVDEKIKRLEKECKLLRKELYQAHQGMELQVSCSKALQTDKRMISDNLEEEKRLRERAEYTVENLEKCLTEKLEHIDVQDVKIKDLERTIRLETRMHDALREDFDGQTSNNEECFMENEQLKMKLIEFKKEYVRLNKLNEDERELYKHEFNKQEKEMLLIKHSMQQKLDNFATNLQDAEENKKTLEKRLTIEKERAYTLENNLREISKEYDEQLELKEFEIAELKKQMDEVEEILSVEREKKMNLTRDYESTIEELERKLASELKRFNTLTSKCKEIQKRAGLAEEEINVLKGRLEKADKKMNEMEELVKKSKSELEILQRTVSATDMSTMKQEVDSKSPVSWGKDGKTEYKIPLNYSEEPLSKGVAKLTKSKDCTTTDPRSRLSKDKNASQRGNAGKTKNSGTKIMFNCTEPRRRYSGRKRNDLDSNNNDSCYYYDRVRTSQRNPSDKPERQTGLLRQHRNSLLRENSRLRYSMKMLNHDCAILNYTLQQVIVEAEQKLESLYSLYMRKESECAAYEQMLAPGGIINSYDPYMVPGDYMETYLPDGACVQSGNYEQYTDGYYDHFGPNDTLMQQQGYAVDEFQYQLQPYQMPNQPFNQMYFVPQVYFPQQIQCLEAPLQLQCETQVLSNQQTRN